MKLLSVFTGFRNATLIVSFSSSRPLTFQSLSVQSAIPKRYQNCGFKYHIMKLRSILPALVVLLPQVAFATTTNMGSVKRLDMSTSNMFSFLRAPTKFIAKDGTSLVNNRGLEKRSSRQCPTGYYKCPLSNVEGCCEIGYTCGMYGGKLGCCPDGQTCDRTSGCDNGETDCGTFCCVSGATCTIDQYGNPACATGGGGGGGGDQCGGMPGYSPCKNMSGCCPTGVDCIPPDFCDIKCQPTDPKCGDGCCPKGQRCRTDLTCEPDTPGSISSLPKSTTPMSTVKSTVLVSSSEEFTTLDQSTTEESVPTLTPTTIDSTTTTKPTTTTTTTRKTNPTTGVSKHTTAAGAMHTAQGGMMGLAVGMAGALLVL